MCFFPAATIRSSQASLSYVGRYKERRALWSDRVSLIAQTDCYCVASLGSIPKCLGRAVRMLWTIFVVLLVLWLLGFGFHIGGGLIHILLVLALVIFVINLVSGRRSAL